MLVPENLRYTKDHEWIRVEGNHGYIGITDFAQEELGDIIFIEIETLNELIEKEEVFGTIEAVKTVSDLFMPVTATVLEINKKLDSQPELVNSDPYGEGWIIKVLLSDAAAVDGLLAADAYASIVGH